MPSRSSEPPAHLRCFALGLRVRADGRSARHNPIRLVPILRAISEIETLPVCRACSSCRAMIFFCVRILTSRAWSHDAPGFHSLAVICQALFETDRMRGVTRKFLKSLASCLLAAVPRTSSQRGSYVSSDA